jgi:hypothetical protein
MKTVVVILCVTLQSNGRVGEWVYCTEVFCQLIISLGMDYSVHFPFHSAVLANSTDSARS